MTVKFIRQWVLCAVLAVVVGGHVLPISNQTASAQLLSVTFTDCAIQTQIPTAECEALVALYNATNGASWTNNTGWLQTATPCSWFGIHCDNESKLTGLHLDSNNLVGTIPVELGDLAHLAVLDLRLNQLTGSIPAELGNLTDLTWLALLNNQLTGSIPPELGSLTNLTTLYLISNQLTGSIPAELGNLTNLTWLSLGFNQLTGSIPAQLGNLTNLRWLFLNTNQLTGAIPPALGNLTRLLDLELDDNQLSDSIPPELGNLTNLTWLKLDNNQLIGSIPTQLGNLTNLEMLSVDNNQLTGPIPAQLGNLINLSWLYLNANQLTGVIPPQLGNLTNLRWLSLNRNHLSGEFPSSLTNLINLSNFTFDCWLTSTDPAVIAFVGALAPGWQNRICPVVVSIMRRNPNPTVSFTVIFSVTLSESVAGVDAGDFSLTTTGVADAFVAGVTGSGDVYTITVNTGYGSGTLRLDVSDNDSILDVDHNPLGGAGVGNGNFTGGDMYVVNRAATLFLPSCRR